MHESGSTARQASLVSRRRLFERLSDGIERGVVLVSAPAGSGKSVLLRSWLDATGLRARAGWASVERDERDGGQFWRGVAEALCGAGMSPALEPLLGASGVPGATVVRRIRQAAEDADEPVVLVVDDLHQLLDAAAMAELDGLLAARPPMLRVVLSTRHDPPIALHRLRLGGELAELRARDLRFQADEARDLLAGAGVALSGRAMASLLERTEGWAAGVRLAALSMTGDADPERFVALFSGSHRAVAEYLFAEVLQRQPERVRRFLLRTSILERLNGSLGDRVAGTTGSEQILLDLEDAGAFVVSLDAQRSWFRYHNLFADLLRLELRRSDGAAIAGLHHAAAEWHAEHGRPVDAIRHAQAAGDWAMAAELLAEHGFSIALDGSFGRVRALLEPFPREALATPELAALLAYGEVVRPQFDAAAAYLSLAERGAGDVPEHRRRPFESLMATTRLTLARWRGDAAAAEREAGPLLEPIEPRSVSDVAAADDARAVALMTLGVAEVWGGAGDAAERHLRETIELARRIGRPYIEMGALAHLAVVVGRRSLTLMRNYAADTVEMLERHGWEAEPVAPVVFAALAVVEAWRGRPAEAAPWLERAERGLPANAEPAKELFVRYARGVERLSGGLAAEAATALAEARRLQSQLVSPDPLGSQARGLEAQALITLGRLSDARSAIATATPDEREHGETRTAIAALELAERRPQEAIAALAPVLAGETPVLAGGSVVNALLVDALARDQLGDRDAAEADVERALDVAEADALVLPFLVTDIAPLLERHPRHRTAHAAFLGTLLDALAGVAPPDRRERHAALAEPLTESELRVLRFLPSNLSAPEIAAEVFLSTSTVKTHMRHIYEKLGAHRRTEAVQLARELGLLGPSSQGRR